jgi:ribokinase
MTRVICLGDVMVDVLAQLPGALAIGSDTPAPISLLGGGSAANTAAWLVAAGVATTFIGRVGDDPLGVMALDELALAGIELAVGVDPLRPTGTCIVLVDDSGERTMVPSVGANAGLGEAPLPAGLLDAATHLHVSGYALFNTGSRPAAEQAARLCAQMGTTFSADAASSAPLHHFGPEPFLAWLASAGARRLLFANLDEARVLVGDPAAQPGAAALALGAHGGEVIVKCGSAGAIWSDGSDVVHADAAAAEVLDTTGAGDAFAAGVLAARLGGADAAGALAAGNLLAARVIGCAGARPQRV